MFIKNTHLTHPFSLNKEEQNLIKKFRLWLQNNLPVKKEREAWYTEDMPERWAAMHRWQKQLYNAGWMCVSWPKKYGGRGVSQVCEYLIGEELAGHGAPYSGNWISLAAVGQALLAFGDEKQKLKYLPLIAKGEDIWCLGVTEPKAGSNIMETETAAIAEGNDYIINGRKIFITHSPRASRCLLLTRTDFSKKPEWSMSMFIVDLKSDGVQINPLRQLHGEENYGEIIFKNVRVPAKNSVGGVNAGWIVQASTWLTESQPPWDVSHRLGLNKLVSDYADAKKNKYTCFDESKIADAIIDAEMVRLTAFRVLRDDSSKNNLRPNGPLVKIAFTEVSQKITETGLDMPSEAGKLEWEAKPTNWVYRHISARSNTIARAPTELHKNFVAHFGLGLSKKAKK